MDQGLGGKFQRFFAPWGFREKGGFFYIFYRRNRPGRRPVFFSRTQMPKIPNGWPMKKELIGKTFMVYNRI
jgi:hypothetical protein